MENLALKHLEKLYSVEGGITKAEVIDYYIKAAPLILPHISNKPFSMIHFPDGAGGKSFYQKQCPSNAPRWIETVPIRSERRGHIDWCILNTPASMVYMANRSVIEMHTWFSRINSLDKPDVAAIDLDPSGNAGFDEAVVIAKAFGVLLRELKIFAVPKTSGGRGIHIFIPIEPVPFKEVQEFLNALCGVIVAAYPSLATTQRMVSKRGNRVYLDAVQNGMGKTIIAPYSLRARANLPVSTPLTWQEIDKANIKPTDFNIRNIFNRLGNTGDLFNDFYKKAQILPKLSQNNRF